jgi:flagellar motility protein MotE (MotC chaperone)
MIIFILIIAAVSGALFYFNIGGISNRVLTQISKIPIFKNMISAKKVDNSQDQLKNLENELSQKEKKLNEREASLNDKQKQLDDLQMQLNKKESDLNNLKLQLDAKKTSMKDLATYYDNMDPQNAAGILNKISDDNIVITILSNMNKDSASKILSFMNADRAAQITKILVNNAQKIP